MLTIEPLFITTFIFPGFIKKTDQERCQNYMGEIFVDNRGARYEISMKMDGTSFTAFHVDGEAGVCGRNWELKADDSNATNSLVRMYIDSGLQTALRDLGKNYAVQGELIGPGIQQNREGLKAHKLFIFDVYNIDESGYVDPLERISFMGDLYASGLKKSMVDHVPILGIDVTLEESGIDTIAKLLADAEGPSLHHAVREGKVYKRMDGKFSFKVISNLFLLKEKD